VCVLFVLMFWYQLLHLKSMLFLVSLSCCFKNLLMSFVLKFCVYISDIFQLIIIIIQASRMFKI